MGERNAAVSLLHASAISVRSVAERMNDQEIRAFLAHGTRTGKLAWVGPSGQPHVAGELLVRLRAAKVDGLRGIAD